MPQPTREQFDAAAQRVLGSAPPGLSREQFFALIDRELQGDRLGQVPEDEPDTFWEGFTSHIGRGIKDALTNNPYLESAANPQDVGDFLQLVIPSGANKVANMASEILGAGQAKAKQATGLLNKIRGFWSGAWEDINAPSLAQTRESMMLDRGAAARPKSVTVGPADDAFERYRRSPDPSGKPFSGDYTGGPPVTLGPQGPAASGPPSARPQGPRPAPSPLEQELASIPDRPPVRPEPQFAGVGEEAVVNTSRLSPQAAAPDTLRSITAKMGMGIDPQEVADLRRLYGSRKAAELLGLTEEDVLKLAPGPSRVPLDVEDKLLNDIEGLWKYLPR